MTTATSPSPTAANPQVFPTADEPVDDTEPRYQRPDAFSQRVFNPLVGRLVRMGVGVAGARLLGVVGRSSGTVRQTVVNVLTIDGERYLVAPRGTTQWVRNLRVARVGTLRLGRSIERFDAVELTGDDRLPILRAYLRKWGWEVGRFFDGVSKTSTDEELAAVADRHPVFRIAR